MDEHMQPWSDHLLSIVLVVLLGRHAVWFSVAKGIHYVYVASGTCLSTVVSC